MITLAYVLVAYLIGSVSFAIIVSRGLSLPDPRTFGSHNPGATNVLRTGNRWAAAMTLAGDAFKGWLAVFLAQRLAPALGVGEAAVAAAALAVFIGHAYPVFFRFEGGKGVATALGLLTALDLRLGLGTLATWVAVFAVSRISSVSALVAAVVAPVLGFYLLDAKVYGVTVLLLALLVLARHKTNIEQLLRGEERRINKT